MTETQLSPSIPRSFWCSAVLIFLVGLLSGMAMATAFSLPAQEPDESGGLPTRKPPATKEVFPTITPTYTPLPITLTPSPTMVPVVYGENVNPLTGLVPENVENLERAPLAVKISNAPSLVRPQQGLELADLVFEHLTEGTLTRFTAIFYSQTPEEVGSVRSARLIDLEIARMYRALFVYSGANGPLRLRIADSSFARRAFEGVSVGEPLYYRVDTIEAPHNLFADPRAVWQRAQDRGINVRPNLQGMSFREDPPAGATDDVTSIAIDFGAETVQWVYDPLQGKYLRAINGVAHTDPAGVPLMTDNVVIIWAHHQPDYTIVESEWQGNKTYATEIQIWTLGPVTIFRDGKRYDGLWHRWSKDEMLTFWTDATRLTRLHLRPGTTWFEVVPLDFAGLTTE